MLLQAEEGERSGHKVWVDEDEDEDEDEDKEQYQRYASDEAFGEDAIAFDYVYEEAADDYRYFLSQYLATR